MDKLYFMKIKNVCSPKDIKKIKSQATRFGGNICDNMYVRMYI